MPEAPDHRLLLVTFDANATSKAHYEKFRQSSNSRWPTSLYNGVDRYLEGQGAFFKPMHQVRILLTNSTAPEIRSGVKRLIGLRPIFITRLSKEWAGAHPNKSLREKFGRWLRDNYLPEELAALE